MSTMSGLLERTSRTFALSIPFLPAELQRSVTVAYLIFRIVDTIEDEFEGEEDDAPSDAEYWKCCRDGNAPAPESSDAYAADSLAADTAALNLLSVGYGDADRRRYAPRQQGYGGY